jgi:hypothetical protein
VAVRALTVVALVLALAASAAAASEWRTISENGVEVRVPPGWERITKASGSIVDPRTVLVVGTRGARPRPSVCQIAAYRVPPAGAVVVVVRWRTTASGGGRPPRSREPLRRIALDSRGFECWPGHRGGVALLTLGCHAYQVNVMVGDRASPRQVRDVLAGVRSFDLAGR